MKKDQAVKKNLDLLNEFMNRSELHREMREKKVGRAYITLASSVEVLSKGVEGLTWTLSYDKLNN